MMYPVGLWGQFHALVSIYARDGTVSVSHGGIECGQGINTKVQRKITNKIYYSKKNSIKKKYII